MKRFSHSTIALALGLAFSAGAMAQGLSKEEYKSRTDGIEAAYQSAAGRCGSFAANAKDICMAESKGKESVAKADLEAQYKPSQETEYQARDARAQADYAVAVQKCDNQAGNAKDVCVAEAKAAQTNAKADAKLQMKTSDAKAEAGVKAADARQDATEAKRDANFAVAKEKC
ncbi:MAG: hypothetical protein ABI423_02380, partial [Burkholderiales bacterium]